MKRQTVWAAVSAIVGAAAIPFAFSQDSRSGAQPGMGGMHGQQGEQEQRGMMGMMQGCPMMSRTGGASSAGLIPQLPPGNEKLQAQMQAEIMQRAGEIAAKYAAQAK